MTTENPTLHAGLRRTFGEPFLSYIFGLDDPSVPDRLFESQTPAVLNELVDVAVRPSFSEGFEANACYNAARHYLARVPGSPTRALAMRVAAGGEALSLGPTPDKFVDHMLKYAELQWPAIALLAGSQTSALTLGPSSFLGHGDHVLHQQCSASLLEDPSLGRLFPENSASVDHFTAPSVHSYWEFEPRFPGTGACFAGDLVNQILLRAIIAINSRGGAWKVESFCSEVEESIDHYRRFANGDAVDFRIFQGMSGLPDDHFRNVLLEGDHRVRRATTLDSHFLKSFGTGTHVIEVGVPTTFKGCIRSYTRPPENGSMVNPEFLFNQIRLAMITCTGDEQLISTCGYSTHFFHPSGTSGASIWEAANYILSPPRVPVSLPASAEDFAVESFKALRRPLSSGNNMNLALHRLIPGSGNRDSPADGFIDTCIAIEAMLNPGRVEKITKRIACAVSYLIHPESAERRTELEKTVEDLYATRSRIVHGNREYAATTIGDLQRTVSLAAQILVSICEHHDISLVEMKPSNRNKKLLEWLDIQELEESAPNRLRWCA